MTIWQNCLIININAAANYSDASGLSPDKWQWSWHTIAFVLAFWFSSWWPTTSSARPVWSSRVLLPRLVLPASSSIASSSTRSCVNIYIITRTSISSAWAARWPTGWTGRTSTGLPRRRQMVWELWGEGSIINMMMMVQYRCCACWYWFPHHCHRDHRMKLDDFRLKVSGGQKLPTCRFLIS